ncbi:MAG: DUF4147 domain-containing protein, partial [Desulfotignum sp.]|nr:DUF4147 domain-containing protein [Desulfotignum sp.]
MNDPNQLQSKNPLKQTAIAIFEAGLRAVAPGACVARHVTVSGSRLHVCGTDMDLNRIQHIYVAGAGKASAAMAEEVEKVLDSRIHDGVVVTKYGHGLPLNYCRVMEAGHPVPDENGMSGAT